MLRRIVSAFLFLMACSVITPAQETKITVISWNAESGVAQPFKVAERIRSFQGVDLWALGEVSSDADASVYETDAEESTRSGVEDSEEFGAGIALGVGIQKSIFPCYAQ